MYKDSNKAHIKSFEDYLSSYKDSVANKDLFWDYLGHACAEVGRRVLR